MRAELYNKGGTMSEHWPLKVAQLRPQKDFYVGWQVNQSGTDCFFINGATFRLPIQPPVTPEIPAKLEKL